MTQQKLATHDARPEPDPLHVLLTGDREAIEAAARTEGLDEVAWMRQTLTAALETRDPRVTASADMERKFRALIKASRHSFPTADIEDIQRLLEWTEQFSFPSGDIKDILRETEAGRWVRYTG